MIYTLCRKDNHNYHRKFYVIYFLLFVYNTVKNIRRMLIKNVFIRFIQYLCRIKPHES